VKFHFEPDLDYQQDAINAVCDLFEGQVECRSEFTVALETLDGQRNLGLEQNELGIGNRLALSDLALLENLRSVQRRSAIMESKSLDSGDFTVEMETGTGKTYVYIRTIFELNRRYGFTKFVIVVPSVAIKEGVYKTLQMTDDHFKSLYAGAPSEYFLYDSTKLGQVRNFAASPTIQIMVVTVGAINKKDVNNLYKESEKTGDERPVDVIRATRPIVIVDEPQSVDGGLKGAGKTALAEMHPLCTLRYSATHIDKHHMVYRLDAVAAYERRLVKQIEVASATVEDAYNSAFVRLVSVGNKRNVISARVQVDKQQASGVHRVEVTVRDGDDLQKVTGRVLYANCAIGEIRVGRGTESLELLIPGSQLFLSPGESWGYVDELAVQRQMIRRTIREHLDKEIRLRPAGVKVLSLFFIDSVERYRAYDDSGSPVKGPYAIMFEEEYSRLANRPEYRDVLGDMSASAAQLHDGYFSIDRRGGWSNTDESNQSDRDSAERAYSLIMRDKERLLSLDTPLSFIFSHSALREGWDNPNVFQICALRDIQSERERRQTIGRGLRLCVDQSGNRVRGFDTNTLTVVSTESYESFADGLQKEIEDATGAKFERSRILNAEERRSVKSRPAVLMSEEFKALWARIKHKTMYRVQFDNERLISDCVRALRDMPPVPRPALQWRKAGIAIGRGGVTAVEREGAATISLSESAIELPDILTELEDRTQLTRKTIYRVLTESGRLDDFRRNPQRFIDAAADAMSRTKRLAIVQGIKYERLGDSHFFAQELFDEEMVGHLRNMIADSRGKSPYDHIVYDSDTEKRFANELEMNSSVKLFAKLPAWFVVPTPLGTYNPDWAVLVEKDGDERLYLVVETKGSVNPDDLRESERAKIACGREHFKALHVMEPAAEYVVASTLREALSAADGAD
jgi:restriction endonuclease